MLPTSGKIALLATGVLLRQTGEPGFGPFLIEGNSISVKPIEEAQSISRLVSSKLVRISD